MPVWLSAYNYDYALATIPIQVVLFAFFVQQRSLPIRQSRTFIAVMAANFIMTVTDIIACEMNEIWTSYSLFAVYGINMAYFVGFLLRGWYLFRYTAEEVYGWKHINRFVYHAAAIPVCIMLLLVMTTPFTDWVFGFYDGIGYKNGIMYRGIYYSTYFYIAASFAVIFYCRHEADTAERLRLYFFNGILIAGIFMRGLFVDTLVTSYFSLMAILVIYLGTQNPGNYMEKRGGVFNTYALYMMVREYVPERKIGIYAFCIKNYNEVRELYGGPRMDEAITQMGTWLRQNMVDQQIFYLRSGAFVLISLSAESQKGLKEKIVERFTLPWGVGATDIYLNIGTMHFSEEVTIQSVSTMMEGLRMALNQLGNEKQINHIEVDKEYVDLLCHRVQVRRAVEEAVENDQVEIYLQPIVSAQTYQLVGAEALARIIDPKLGFLSPRDFIPIAERSGSFSLFGKQVFRKGCAFLAEYGDELPMLKWLNVNLSPIQCMDRTLSHTFSEIRDTYGIDAKRIHLEITEEVFMSPEVLDQQLEKMRKKGFQFVLDDYGSGYSNALMVKSIPFVNVKIDMGMVRAHFSNPDNVLPNTIRAFRDMGAEVTVEGVETAEMAKALRDMGAVYLQGYYFAKPMPIEDFVEYAQNQMN